MDWLSLPNSWSSDDWERAALVIIAIGCYGLLVRIVGGFASVNSKGPRDSQ